jgi:uncharacterized phage protein (TIGR01671 family)
MRVPKFRAWDEDSKKMNGNVEIYINKDKTIEVRHKDDKTIVMQSTGLKDKKGKEIYEGDIVKFSDCDDDAYVTPVVWDKNYACFGVSFSGKYPISFDYLEEFYTELKDIEVVGNIYENPELVGE